jgi:hypothetical protein
LVSLLPAVLDSVFAVSVEAVADSGFLESDVTVFEEDDSPDLVL